MTPLLKKQILVFVICYALFLLGVLILRPRSEKTHNPEVMTTNVKAEESQFVWSVDVNKDKKIGAILGDNGWCYLWIESSNPPETTIKHTLNQVCN